MSLFDEEIEVTNKAIVAGADESGALDDIADIDDLGKEALTVVEVPAVAPTKPASRYAGKTQEELSQMLEDAQAHIGRQSSEIGEVRKLADDLVKKSLTVPTKETPAEEHEDDFFTDPAAAVARAVSKHPAVAAAKEAGEIAAREKASARVLASHPDMAQVTGSPEFVAWVKASPMRVRMYALADQYDSEAADELLSNFKASNSIVKPVTPLVADGAAKAAATLAAGSVGTSATSASAPASKKYRRSDIMRLMNTNPARYEAMADEILKAYAEGRVV
jgi:hypothetical protein